MAYGCRDLHNVVLQSVCVKTMVPLPHQVKDKLKNANNPHGSSSIFHDSLNYKLINGRLFLKLGHPWP